MVVIIVNSNGFKRFMQNEISPNVVKNRETFLLYLQVEIRRLRL